MGEVRRRVRASGEDEATRVTGISFLNVKYIASWGSAPLRCYYRLFLQARFGINESYFGCYVDIYRVISIFELTFVLGEIEKRGFATHRYLLK